MKQVVIDRYGVPQEVAACAELPDVGAPAPGEVVFDVLLFPINPADVSFCKGLYRLRPALPATPGAECIGRVTAVGLGVSHVKPGDLVINLQRENWTQRRRVGADDVIAVPAGLDLRQAAMLRINPPTALLLLTDIVDLGQGEWVIQNVANSAVGRLLIRLARARGLRTLNVVRRSSLFAELEALGADVCVVDGPDLPEAAKAAAGGAPIRLGIDAVSGHATARISASLGDGGVVCNYGSMSGEDPGMARAALTSGGRAVSSAAGSPRARSRRSASSTPISPGRSRTDISRRLSRRSTPSRTSRPPSSTPSRAGARERSWSRPTAPSDRSRRRARAR